ncbi:hypothetical protein CI592_05185 [Fischerella thermalis CCMEE 5328]|nr:hypothetical protein CI592_05185 [Fischerella thermalis CCMEE 5328]
MNLSQNPEKVKPLKTQSLTLAKALELAERNHQGLSEENRLTVLLEYYDVQQADEVVRIVQSAIRNAEVTLRDAQALERAGVGYHIDVLQARLNLANAQQALNYAVSQQRVERSHLAFQLGLPYSITGVSPADPIRLAGIWNQTLEESIGLASQNRSKQQLQRTQKSLQIEKSYRCLQANLNNVQTSNAAIDVAREVVRLARLQFQAGVGTQASIIKAQNMLTISENQMVKSILDYNRALAYMQRYASSSEITSSNHPYELYKEKDNNCSYGKSMIILPNSL